MRALLVGSLVIVGACGAAPPPAGGPSTEPTEPSKEFEASIAKMQEFATRMCACAELACADEAQAELARWAEKQMAKDGGSRALPEQLQRMTTVSEQYHGCMTAIATPAALDTDDGAGVPIGDGTIIEGEATVDGETVRDAPAGP